MRRALRATIDYIKKADMLLLALCVISTLFGIILIYSATKSSEAGYQRDVSVQAGSLILGIFMFVIFSIIDIEIIADKWKVLLVFNILFICTLFVFGQEGETGNRAWLRFAGIGIQPAEVVKITFIIVVAKQMQHLREFRDLNSFFSILQLVVHFGLTFMLLLVASKDLGSALVYAFIFIVMLYTGGIKLRWFALGAAIIGLLVPVAWKYGLTLKQQDRIMAPFDSNIDPTHTGVKWQSWRSTIAIASGKLTGQGLGNGTQTQAGTIPEQRTDFIFSVAGEELGFIGCMAIILLLTAIIIRCIYVGVKARNQLSAQVCMGIAAMLLIQTLENIGMCLSLTPVIGLTLPFFSSGGSSIVTLFVCMGIVCGVKMRTVSPWKRPL